ncbi:MAG: hypothetical protein UX09_C0046G0012 [Candidatus Uhrbacteria bacterium GW2011_GWE2_45_35]|uniref:Uncharacterized protein n=2 Tax=Candidatus Uhriibacteriota TaxID=1752732 RepID=A0A0G1JG00_9BACT|nr:MAG: hypothetical protein UW63_C0031G0003 [Candidatus Uhrbacteria bacterium GW2011_GWF2_44_350]KKU06650.1 MAG: hypothetical protein UX09_C0046G0012 [Candidatus Uhrbacteria bacterium GW2011_GWE2_45_35]HBR80702.1 hypothetical protein [Candidatus Uhrbacteria bacterium]HCU31664.1 hypothetical protein [Candidatus Uhrbacteria bacterium]
MVPTVAEAVTQGGGRAHDFLNAIGAFDWEEDSTLELVEESEEVLADDGLVDDGSGAGTTAGLGSGGRRGERHLGTISCLVSQGSRFAVLRPRVWHGSNRLQGFGLDVKMVFIYTSAIKSFRWNQPICFLPLKRVQIRPAEVLPWSRKTRSR